MWTLETGGAMPLWQLTPAMPGVRMAFTTRRGGVSKPPYDTLNLGQSTADRPDAVAENRRRLLAALGLPAASVATAGQVHGATVLEVSEPGHSPACDALVTRRRRLALAVSTADCLPLIIVTPGAVCVAHSGWRGTAAGMPRAALAATCAVAGVGPAAAHVHLGPCIRACCYEVGPEVVRQFPAAVTHDIRGHRHLDLVAAARLQLLAAGAAPEAVFDTGDCTACRPGWYFSHRRDGAPSGRHWAIVSIES